MQQTLQPVVCDPEPGPSTALGKLQNVETGDTVLSDIAYSTQKNDEIQPVPDHSGSCRITGKGQCSAGSSCSITARLLILPVIFYRRFISPFFPPCCRFTPSCSGYAIEALKKRGAIVGSLLIIWRLLRCNPFCRGGYDPVPEKRSKSPGKAFRKSDRE